MRKISTFFLFLGVLVLAGCGAGGTPASSATAAKTIQPQAVIPPAETPPAAKTAPC